MKGEPLGSPFFVYLNLFLAERKCDYDDSLHKTRALLFFLR
jgi:hypothetical protein